MQVKCCKSTCEVTNIRDLLACHYCFDKAFDKFYDMHTATWYVMDFSTTIVQIFYENHTNIYWDDSSFLTCCACMLGWWGSWGPWNICWVFLVSVWIKVSAAGSETTCFFIEHLSAKSIYVLLLIKSALVFATLLIAGKELDYQWSGVLFAVKITLNGASIDISGQLSYSCVVLLTIALLVAGGCCRHRMNCLNADVEDRAYIISKNAEKNKCILQLNDFIF